MGGTGSGRHWYLDAHETTLDYKSLDIRRWQREILLQAGVSFTSSWTRNGEPLGSIDVAIEDRSVVTFTYSYRSSGSEWVNKNYEVGLDWTSCNFGGSRVWFKCPAYGCGRRVAILYGGAVFACRHCYRLVYRSQREEKYDRALGKADRIRDRLGWKPGVANPRGGKPKGMHWRTFLRLTHQHDQFYYQSFPPWLMRLVGD